jgi:hypothetical protein
MIPVFLFLLLKKNRRGRGDMKLRNKKFKYFILFGGIIENVS